MEQERRYFCRNTGTVITLGASGLAAFSMMGYQQPVLAQVTAQDVQDEIAKFNIVNGAILALVQSFTLVMILPLGVRAGNQLFKHLILASM